MDDKRCEQGCSCNPGIARREFLRLTGAQTAALLVAGVPVMAGPFARSDFQFLVPADKKLSPEWVESLTARGDPTVYRGAELETIGMPVGGICAGQLYLGGDGRLWHWDIFNQHIGTGAAHYAKPMKPSSPVEQGFAADRRRPNRAARPHRLRRRPLPRRVSDRDRRVPRRGRSGGRHARGLLAVHSARDRRFQPAGHGDAVHRAEHVRRAGRGDAGRMAGERRAPRPPRHAGHAAQPDRRRRRLHLPRLLGAEARRVRRTGAARRRLRGLEQGHLRGLEGRGHGVRQRAGSEEGDPAIPGRRRRRHRAGGQLARQRARQRTRARATTRPARSPAGRSRSSATSSTSGSAAAITRADVREPAGRRQGGAHGHRPEQQPDDGPRLRRAAVPRAARRSSRSSTRRPAAGATSASAGSCSATAGRARVASTSCPTSARWAWRCSAGSPATSRGHGGARRATKPPSRLRRSSSASSAERSGSSPASRRRSRSSSPGTSRTSRSTACASAGATTRRGSTRRARWRSYVAANFDRLAAQTRLWHDTWYDSTLPYWFLDRTFLNTSILATSTCYRLAARPVLGWEGVGCCEGTCGHVWHYAHAVARLFPELERNVRERVDFGLALQPDGAIHFRGEHNDDPGHRRPGRHHPARATASTRCRADDAFLKRNWPAIKQATRVADRQGRRRRRHHRRHPAQHARHRLVRPGRVAQRPVPGRAARRRGDGRRDAATTRSPRQCREIVDARPHEHRRAAVRRRVLHQQARPEAPRRDQLRQRLRDRPGVRPELGVPGRPAAASCRRRRRWRRCAVAVAVQLHARRRAVSRGATSRAAGTRWPARRAC